MLRGLTVQVPRRHRGLPGRPERRRQVHRAQGRQRAARAALRPDPGRRRRTSPATARSSMLAAGARPRAPGPQRLPGDDRRRERPARRLHAQGQGASSPSGPTSSRTCSRSSRERWTRAGRAALRRPAEAGGVRPLADGQPEGACCSTSRRWASTPRPPARSSSRSCGCATPGTAVLLVEQNARRALETADLGCVLDLGRVHITGPARRAARRPAARRALPRRPSRPTPPPDLPRRTQCPTRPTASS